MIALLARHDDAYRRLPKWIVVTVFLGTTWLGLVTFLARARVAPDPWLLVVLCWLGPACHLAMQATTARSNTAWLALPIAGRRLWLARGLAVLAASGAVLAATVIVTFGTVGFLTQLRGPLNVALAPIVGVIPRACLHLAAMWVLGVAVVQARRPELSGMPTRGWSDAVFVVVFVTVSANLLAVLGSRGVWTAAIPLLLAALVMVVTWRRVPAALLIAPTAMASASSRAIAPAPSIRADRTRIAIPAVVLRTTAKNPLMHLVAYPVLALLGLLLGDNHVAHTFEGFEGYLLVAITAYTLFSVTASSLLRAGPLDHLPLARGRLLAIILVPQIVCLLAGMASGYVVDAIRHRPAAPAPAYAIVWHGHGATPGRSDEVVGSVIRGRPPAIVPAAKPAPVHPAAVPILETLLAGSLFLLALGLYLGWFRANASRRRRGAVFAAILTVMLALHLTPYVLVVSNLIRPQPLSMFLLLLSSRIAGALPGGVVTLGVLAVVILAGWTRWVMARLGQAELPPAEGCVF